MHMSSHGSAPRYLVDDCQLVAVFYSDRQTLPHVSFLVALLVSAIGHFLSLDHVCGTVFYTFADLIFLNSNSVER